MLLVIEGIDGSGKTTLSHNICKKIPGSQRMAFPDRSKESGKLLDSVLSGKVKLDPYAMQMLFAINRRECINEINGYLQNNQTVILDRYTLSGKVYGSLDGLEPSFIDNLEVGLPVPDLIVYLDVDPVISNKRIAVAGIYDAIEKQKKLAGKYKEIILKMKNSISGPKILMVDTGTLNETESVDAVLRELEKCIKTPPCI